MLCFETEMLEDGRVLSRRVCGILLGHGLLKLGALFSGGIWTHHNGTWTPRTLVAAIRPVLSQQLRSVPFSSVEIVRWVLQPPFHLLHAFTGSSGAALVSSF